MAAAAELDSAEIVLPAQPDPAPDPVVSTELPTSAHLTTAASASATDPPVPSVSTADSAHLLHVRPLSRSVTAQHLRDIFSHFGDVSLVAVPLDASVQLPLGYGVVGMERGEDAERAASCMHGGWIDGQQVTCTRKGAKAAGTPQHSAQQPLTSEATSPHSNSHHSLGDSPPSTRRSSASHHDDTRDDKRRSRSPKRRHSLVSHRERETGRGRRAGHDSHRRGSFAHKQSSRSRSRSPFATSRGRSESSRSISRSRSRDRHRRRR